MQKRTCRRGGKKGGRRVKSRNTCGRSRKTRRGGQEDNPYHLTQDQWDHFVAGEVYPPRQMGVSWVNLSKTARWVVMVGYEEEQRIEVVIWIEPKGHAKNNTIFHLLNCVIPDLERSFDFFWLRGGKQGGRRVKYRKTRGRSRKARRGGTPGDLPFFNKDHIIEGRYS